jgi:hypothetical protein
MSLAIDRATDSRRLTGRPLMTQRRYELTDREWSIIAPLLPNKPRGLPRIDDRRVLNGILWHRHAL